MFLSVIVPIHDSTPYWKPVLCVSIIHQQENTSAVICTLLYRSQCISDLFFEYCNCANTHLMVFSWPQLALLIFEGQIRRTGGRKGTKSEGYLFHQLNAKSCITSHELKWIRLHNVNEWVGSLIKLCYHSTGWGGIMRHTSLWCKLSRGQHKCCYISTSTSSHGLSNTAWIVIMKI